MAEYRVNSENAAHAGGYAADPAGASVERSGSGVAWGAIFAGAVGAASLSLVLLLLGTGLGLSTISPWASQGASATAIGVATILWITFTQLAASGAGGYLAGRLRTKWAGVHTDEVYFRDTAHGFLAWAVATLLTAALLTSAVGSIVGAGAQAGASVAGGAATLATTATAASASQRGERRDPCGPSFQAVGGPATIAAACCCAWPKDSRTAAVRPRRTATSRPPPRRSRSRRCSTRRARAGRWVTAPRRR